MIEPLDLDDTKPKKEEGDDGDSHTSDELIEKEEAEQA